MVLIINAITYIIAWELGKWIGGKVANKFWPVYEYKVSSPEEFVEVLIQMQKDLQKEVEKKK